MENFINRLDQLVHKYKKQSHPDNEINIYDAVSRLVHLIDKFNTSIDNLECQSDNELHFKNLTINLQKYRAYTTIQLVQYIPPEQSKASNKPIFFNVTAKANNIPYRHGELYGSIIIFYTFDGDYTIFFHTDVYNIQDYLQSIVDNELCVVSSTKKHNPSDKFDYNYTAS